MRINQQKIIKERMVVTNEEYEIIQRVITMFEETVNDAEDAQLAADAQEALDCIIYVTNEWIDIDD